jgi:hypothetical protein
MEGREEGEDGKGPGRPSTSNTEENVEKIGEIVWKDRRFCIQMIAEMVITDKETVRQIHHDQLNMMKVRAKWSRKTLLKNKTTTGKHFALTSWNESQNNRLCLKMSSYVIKLGFLTRIQKRRDN